MGIVRMSCWKRSVATNIRNNYSVVQMPVMHLALSPGVALVLHRL